MRTALAIAVPLGTFLTLVAWRLSQLLSPDAIAMALGLTLGVIACFPATLLVLSAGRRRDSEDYDDGSYIDVQPTYQDQVTPYTHLARRVMQLPKLPDRQTEIDQLRAVLDYIEAQEVTR